MMTIPEAFAFATGHHRAGRLRDAEAVYRKILEVEPNHAGALHRLGVLAAQLGRKQAAAQLIARAVALRPDDPDMHCDLGNVLQAQGRIDEAMAAYRWALVLAPGHPAAEMNLGTVLQGAGRIDEAVDSYGRALAQDPAYAEAWFNLGTALHRLGRLDAAAAFDRALALRPDFAEAHFNRALLLLLRGDLVEGWQEYEWRWRQRAALRRQRAFAQPQWQGQDPNGRTILLHAEQGLGDTLQFVRYAPLVARRGARVLLEVQEGLTGLLGALPGVAQVIASDGGPLPDFDWQCSLLSLPRAFGTTLPSIPAEVPISTPIRHGRRLGRRGWRRPAPMACASAWSGPAVHGPTAPTPRRSTGGGRWPWRRSPRSQRCRV